MQSSTTIRIRNRSSLSDREGHLRQRRRFGYGSNVRGHDEYLHNVVKDYLPTEALYMNPLSLILPAASRWRVRLSDDEKDREMFKWVRAFNLTTSTPRAMSGQIERAKPFYDELISEYFPATLKW